MFDLFQARTILNEYDYQSILDYASKHYKCDKNSITSNMFLAFVYAINLCDNKKLTD